MMKFLNGKPTMLQIMEQRNHLQSVLTEVAEERQRQDAKWGIQDCTDGTSELNAGLRDYLIKQCDDAAMNGDVTWTHILSEELMEAFSETDPDKIRAELVQCCAVAVSWIQAIDRRP